MKTIPPIRKNVPAGFSVFKAGENPEVFLYLESGELAALVKSNGKDKELFKIQPDELIGLPSLLEKQAFAYDIVATRDSSYLEIDEECLASTLKSTPVWLLAGIRQINQQIKKAKSASLNIKSTNVSKVLASFLYSKAKLCSIQNQTPIFENYNILLKECAWISRIPFQVLKDELFSLERRKLVFIHQNELGIQEPLLLQALEEYLAYTERGKEFPPFHINLVEKRAVHCISRQGNISLESSEWLEKLKSNDKFATISEVNLLEKLGLLKKVESNTLTPDEEQIQKYLLCFEYEKEIKGNML